MTLKEMRGDDNECKPSGGWNKINLVGICHD